MNKDFDDLKYFAAHALNGILAREAEIFTHDEICLLAWSYAETMIEIGKQLKDTP